MENQLTPKAAQVMALAQKEATRLQHSFIGTEHILLGLLKLGEESSAATVLASCGLALENIKTELEKQVKPGLEALTEVPPFTPRTKTVLRLAGKERQATGDSLVGTEHLLLGMLREGDGLAARVLRELGMNIEKARHEVLKLRPVASPPSTITEITGEPNLQELFKIADGLLENPSQRLRLTPRVLAAICAVNHLECDDNERENLFLAVLAHLRDKSKA